MADYRLIILYKERLCGRHVTIRLTVCVSQRKWII